MRTARRPAACLFVVAAAFAPAVSWAQATAAGSGRHFVWRVTKDTKTIAWLVGSVHVLTKDAYPLPAIYERAFAESHTLVEEVDLGAASDPAIVLPIAAQAMLTGGRTLSTLLDRETAALVAAKATAVGLPMLAVERMKPWLAAMTLAVPALQRAGYDPSLGLDRHFYDRAQATARPVRGLETAASQIAALDALPMPVQIDMLKAVLSDIDTQVSGVAEIVRAWRAGDVAALERFLLDEFRESPDVYQRVLVDRNRAWVPQIAACASDAAPCLVVVGGAHLVGADSVVAMLAAAGFSVEQQ
ncbi:MAG: TraB/GumN family protein [Acidobacteria bacterium]|nr:TraB/GumN family protein [Acidobacteriota bacterium]